jgi:transposase
MNNRIKNSDSAGNLPSGNSLITTNTNSAAGCDIAPGEQLSDSAQPTKSDATSVTKSARKASGQGLAEIKQGTLVCLGLDVHARQITVVRQIDRSLPQPAQRFSEEDLLAWVQKMMDLGATVISCYEAGCMGYVLDRKLTAIGALNLVVTPQVLSKLKTDKIDARELCLRRERYHAGNLRAFSVVRVPTPEQEAWRERGRHRDRILKERTRLEKRGGSLMLKLGLHAPKGWWKPLAWKDLRKLLAPELAVQVGFWQAKIIELESSQAEAKKALEEEVSQRMESLPSGLGDFTWHRLCGEIVTWTRFKSRREVGSYTGLCPQEKSSGESRRQGSINRHGNPRVRALLIECAWRLTRYESGWHGFLKCPAVLDRKSGSVQRKKQIVAAARRLAVDLWRLETGQTTAEKLGFSKAFSFKPTPLAAASTAAQPASEGAVESGPAGGK